MGLVFLINCYYIFELCSVTFVGFDIYIYILFWVNEIEICHYGKKAA